MVKTKVIEENDEKITILLSDVDRAFVNAIRRTLISDTPKICLLYTSPSPRDQRGSRMPSSA